jgi:hypothetical protein
MAKEFVVESAHLSSTVLRQALALPFEALGLFHDEERSKKKTKEDSRE